MAENETSTDGRAVLLTTDAGLAAVVDVRCRKTTIEIMHARREALNACAWLGDVEAVVGGAGGDIYHLDFRNPK